MIETIAPRNRMRLKLIGFALSHPSISKETEAHNPLSGGYGDGGLVTTPAETGTGRKTLLR